MDDSHKLAAATAAVAAAGRWIARMIEKERDRDHHRVSNTAGVIVLSVLVPFILWWFRTSRRRRSSSSSSSSVPEMASVRKSSWPSKNFGLMIDGCNGPIKFCPDKLTSTEGTSTKPSWPPSPSLPSFFSTLWYRLGNPTGKNERERTGQTRRRRRRYSDMLTLINVDPDSAGHKHNNHHHHQPHQQKQAHLDLIDSLERLLEDEDYQEEDKEGETGEQDGGGDEDRSKTPSSPPCSIIFDGVARFSRSNPSTTSVAKYNNEKNHTNCCCEHNQVYRISDRIQIEITGFYDEADNVLVDRCLSSTKDNDSRISSSMITTSSLSRPSGPSVYYEVVIVERTGIGPGKNRSIFQPLHLLRPHSVLCLFTTGFPPKLQHQSNQILQKLPTTTQQPNNKWTNQQPRKPPPKPSSPFFELRTVRIESGTNKTTTRNDDEANLVTQATIVVTDDIYLRQRVVNDAKCFVMTFDQLWTLLLCSHDD